MTNPLKIQCKLERQAQRSARRTARTEFRQVMRQQRLHQKHEREMEKIKRGYYHKRAEVVGDVVKPLADLVDGIFVPTFGIISTLIGTK